MISSADHFLMGQFVQEKQAVYISKGLSHVTEGGGEGRPGMPKTNI